MSKHDNPQAGKIEGSRPILFETEYLTYALKPDGSHGSFVDRRDGVDYLKDSPDYFLCRAEHGGQIHNPARAAFRDGRLTVVFMDPDLTIDFRVDTHPSFLAFEIISMAGSEPTRLILGNITVGPVESTGYQVGVTRGERYTVFLRALSLNTVLGRAESHSGRVATLRCEAGGDSGFVGARFALAGCPREKTRDVLKEVLTEGNTHYTLSGGPWAEGSDIARASYIFCTPSVNDADKWVDLARLSGVSQLLLVGVARYGDHSPRSDLYPGGMDDLKKVVEIFHAAGLAVGYHNLSACISKSSSFVTPVPDPGLFKDAHYRLAEPVDEKTTTIPTTEIPSGDTFGGYTSKGNDIQIGDEIITYTGLSTTPPYAFIGCKRGAHGTRPGSHDGGTTVSHLGERFGHYLPDPKSELWEKTIRFFADLYNECGFDMLYFDGLEALNALGGNRLEDDRIVCDYAWQVVERLPRSTATEGSTYVHALWPMRTRLGAWDYPHYGIKRWIDYHCEKNRDQRARELLPTQLGWWNLLTATPDYEAATPDQVEYMCCKALGNDMAFSIQGVQVADRPAGEELAEIGGDIVTEEGYAVTSGERQEMLALIGRYERLRLAGVVPESVKTRLREPGREFRLSQRSKDECLLTPTVFLSHRIESFTTEGQTEHNTTWTIDNPYGQQPLQLQIKALVTGEPFDSPRGISLTEFKGGEFQKEAAPGVQCDLDLSRTDMDGREVLGTFKARNDGSVARGAWARVTKSFEPPLDMSSHRVIGLWIHGDGKGELLNVQLSNPQQETFESYEEQYIRIDFKGWRYYQLPLIERSADEFLDYQWPYGAGRWYILTGR
ncbi:hypothetical protein HQ520_09000, partial [bacterium]|nr:hypothetical protein [bacterium]